MFCIVIYTKDTDSIAHELADLTQYFRAAHQPNADAKYFDLNIFICIEQPSVFTTLLIVMLSWHYGLASGITLYNDLCQFFHSRFADLIGRQYTQKLEHDPSA